MKNFLNGRVEWAVREEKLEGKLSKINLRSNQSKIMNRNDDAFKMLPKLQIMKGPRKREASQLAYNLRFGAPFGCPERWC